MNQTQGFVPPPYPHDRLKDLLVEARQSHAKLLDLSIGVPCDRPTITGDLHNDEAIRRYPNSFGTEPFRQAAANWLNRYTGTTIEADQVRATVGSKEFVAGLPQYLKLRSPQKDTVLYPAVSYPSYAMGATLAGCRAVAVRTDANWRIDVSSIDPKDAKRALCLWVNTPGNPAGGVDNLAEIADWGRANNVPVISDECYIAFTWDKSPQTILSNGTEGVLAVHSLSKRSNFPGLRIGFYAGDAELLDYLGEVRKHAGFMPPGVSQLAAIEAFADESHVDEQRQKYQQRLTLLAEYMGALGAEATMPEGGFYLWVKSPEGDGWDFTRKLALEHGVVVSPGDFYGDAGKNYVRLAAVQPLEAVDAFKKASGC